MYVVCYKFFRITEYTLVARSSKFVLFTRPGPRVYFADREYELTFGGYFRIFLHRDRNGFQGGSEPPRTPTSVSSMPL